MKKHILLLPLFLLTLLLLSSCEEVISYELDTAQEKLVVEGLVTDQPGPYSVRLSTTKGYLAEGRTPGVNGATITISDNQGDIDTLRQVSEGLYQSTKLQGKAGNTYYLKAVVNGNTYTAQSYMASVATLDSLTFESTPARHMVEEGFYPYLHFQEPVGKGNYYRFNVYLNGALLPDELAVLSDDLYDGNYGHANMGFVIKQGDKLRVELLGMDKPAYTFWFALMNQQSAGGGPFETTPANAKGNISNEAIGYFGASAVSIIESEVN